MDEETRCGNCKFWLDTQPQTSGGDCRIRAPQIVAGQIRFVDKFVDAETAVLAYWPNTGETDWCGEFQEAA